MASAQPTLPPRLYVKYGENQAVQLYTERLNVPQGLAPTVADLVAAFFPGVSPAELGRYSLHLPDGVARAGLPNDWFLNQSGDDSILDTGCALSSLCSTNPESSEPYISQSSRTPFIIQAQGQGIVVANGSRKDHLRY